MFKYYILKYSQYFKTYVENINNSQLLKIKNIYQLNYHYQEIIQYYNNRIIGNLIYKYNRSSIILLLLRNIKVNTLILSNHYIFFIKKIVIVLFLLKKLIVFKVSSRRLLNGLLIQEEQAYIIKLIFSTQYIKNLIGYLFNLFDNQRLIFFNNIDTSYCGYIRKFGYFFSKNLNYWIKVYFIFFFNKLKYSHNSINFLNQINTHLESVATSGNVCFSSNQFFNNLQSQPYKRYFNYKVSFVNTIKLDNFNKWNYVTNFKILSNLKSNFWTYLNGSIFKKNRLVLPLELTNKRFSNLLLFPYKKFFINSKIQFVSSNIVFFNLLKKVLYYSNNKFTNYFFKKFQQKFNWVFFNLIFFKNTSHLEFFISNFCFWRSFKKHRFLLSACRLFFAKNKKILTQISLFCGVSFILKGKLNSIGGAKKKKKNDRSVIYLRIY